MTGQHFRKLLLSCLFTAFFTGCSLIPEIGFIAWRFDQSGSNGAELLEHCQGSALEVHSLQDDSDTHVPLQFREEHHEKQARCLMNHGFVPYMRLASSGVKDIEDLAADLNFCRHEQQAGKITTAFLEKAFNIPAPERTRLIRCMKQRDWDVVTADFSIGEYDEPIFDEFMPHKPMLANVGSLVMDVATAAQFEYPTQPRFLTYEKAQKHLEELNRMKDTKTSDWRLPQGDEMISIVAKLPKGAIPPGKYWLGPGLAPFVMDVSSGDIGLHPADPPFGAWLIPVKGGWAAGRSPKTNIHSLTVLNSESGKIINKSIQ